MSAVQIAFANYFKVERARAEAALADIHNVVCGQHTDEEMVERVMNRLERYYGRYGEPGSLEPLGSALADLSNEPSLPPNGAK